MIAILKRDFISYFTSPVGYAFLAVFTLFTGFFFVLNNALLLNASIAPVFANAIIVFMFIIPLMTVKMLTEERKSKTDQILLTSPVTVIEIVLGKYLAAVFVYFIALFITLTYVVIVTIFGSPGFSEIFTNYIGVFLLGAAIISIALYISSLTDNQFVGAILSFGVIMFLYLLNWFIDNIPSALIKEILGWFAIANRFNDFSRGILALDSIVYYVSICVLFNILTVFSIEKRRWR